MKNKSLFLAIPALLLMAIAIFAFSKPTIDQKASLTPVLVWFQVDEDGNPIDESNGQAGSNPFGCPNTGSNLCSRALTFDAANPSASEVIDNNDGTYTIKAGVDISSPA